MAGAPDVYRQGTEIKRVFLRSPWRLRLLLEMRIVYLPTVVISLGCFLTSMAQIPVGTWRDHFPYAETTDICAGRGHVYAATGSAVIDVNTADNSMERISKVNLLSDVGISAIAYDTITATLLVAYANGNLDLISGGVAFNLSDIKRSSLVGDKRIYEVLPHNGKAYLGTGFGIVVIDLVKREVSATYFIGDQGAQVKVEDLDIEAGAIYATSREQIYFASLNEPFIASFETWSTLEPLPASGGYVDLAFYGDDLFLNEQGEGIYRIWRRQGETWSQFLSSETYPFQDIGAQAGRLLVCSADNVQAYDASLALVLENPYHLGIRVNCRSAYWDGSQNLWFANNQFGLCRHQSNGTDTYYLPPGPERSSARRIAAYNNNLYIAHGGIDASWGNLWQVTGISALVDEKWKVIPNPPGSNEDNVTRDLMDVAIDPADNTHVYLGSWEEGLVEISGGQTFVFNPQNSPLQDAGFSWFSGFTAVGGVAFDQERQLWLTNSMSDRPVIARDIAGNFYPFSFSNLFSGDEKWGDIMPTSRGYIWAVATNRGILVLNPAGTLSATSDDSFVFLNEETGQGGLPVRDVLSMEEDLDGEVWVGTYQGIAVFYNQDCLFTGDPCDAEQILINQDGNTQVLLETEAITAIEIDGGNRKWVGTQNSGVFLFSPDGIETIAHFTEENSPLPSNNIFDIAINHGTGEIFFATEKGLVSLMSDAANFEVEMNNVKVFPNPVRPDFTGVISIDGLAFDTDVKITDAAGNLVFETSSEGGRATWDGRTRDGQPVVNGMYLVYAGNAQTRNARVARIAILR